MADNPDISLIVGIKGDDAQAASVGQRLGVIAKESAQGQLDKLSLKGLNFNAATTSLGGLQTQLKGIRDESSRLNDSLELGARRIIAFSAASTAIFGITKLFRESLAASRELEKSLASINVVLNLPTTQVENFGKQLFDVARSTAQSFQEVAKAATEFSRQGLGVEEILKRTKAALLLVNLAGLDAAEGTKTITAAINSFSKENLDAIDIVNKLVAVDTKFAVSSADLAKAITRVGSTAQEAGVGFDRLIGLVTAAQQVTQRGGEVIGTAFQTIFTRLQRKDALEALGNLGIQIREVDNATGRYTGNLVSADRILSQLATTFKSLTQEQKAQVSEVVAGTRQINVLTGLLNGLKFSQEAYATSVGAGDAALVRQNILLETQADKLKNAGTTFQQLGANIGKVGFGDATNKLLDSFNKGTVSDLIIKPLTGTAGDAGNEFGKIFIKSISDIIIGAGAPIVAALGIKISTQLASILSTFTKQILPSQKDTSAQDAITNAIRQQSVEITNIIKSDDTRIVQEQKILTLLREQLIISGEIAALNSLSGRGAPATKASGYIPNVASGLSDAYARESSAISRGVGGASSSAKPVYLPNFNAGTSKGIVANTDEYLVPNYAGSGNSAIFNQEMIRKFGLPKDATKIGPGFELPTRPSFKPKIVSREGQLVLDFINRFDEALFKTAKRTTAPSHISTISPEARQEIGGNLSEEELSKLLDIGHFAHGNVPNAATGRLSDILSRASKIIRRNPDINLSAFKNSLGEDDFIKVISNLKNPQALGEESQRGRRAFGLIGQQFPNVQTAAIGVRGDTVRQIGPRGLLPSSPELQQLQELARAQGVGESGLAEYIRTNFGSQPVSEQTILSSLKQNPLALQFKFNQPEFAPSTFQSSRQAATSQTTNQLAIRPPSQFSSPTIDLTQAAPNVANQSRGLLLENTPPPRQPIITPLPGQDIRTLETQTTDFIKKADAKIQQVTRNLRAFGELDENIAKYIAKTQQSLRPGGQSPEVISPEEQQRITGRIGISEALLHKPVQNQIQTAALSRTAGGVLEAASSTLKNAPIELQNAFKNLRAEIAEDITILQRKNLTDKQRVDINQRVNENFGRVQGVAETAEGIERETPFSSIRRGIRSLNNRFPRLGPEGLSRVGNLGTGLSFAAPFAIEAIGSGIANQAGNDDITKERIGRATSGVSQAVSFAGVGATIAAAAPPAAIPILAVTALISSFVALKAIVDNSKESIDDLAKRSENLARENAQAIQTIQSARVGADKLQELVRTGAPQEQVKKQQEENLRTAESITSPEIRRLSIEQTLNPNIDNTKAISALTEELEKTNNQKETLSAGNIAKTFDTAFKSLSTGEGLGTSVASLRGIGRNLAQTNPEEQFQTLGDELSKIVFRAGSRGISGSSRQEQQAAESEIRKLDLSGIDVTKFKELAEVIGQGGKRGEEARAQLQAMFDTIKDGAKTSVEAKAAIEARNTKELTSLQEVIRVSQIRRDQEAAFIKETGAFNVRRFEGSVSQGIGISGLENRGASQATIELQKIQNNERNIGEDRVRSEADNLEKLKQAFQQLGSQDLIEALKKETKNPEAFSELGSKVLNAPAIGGATGAGTEINKLIFQLEEIKKGSVVVNPELEKLIERFKDLASATANNNTLTEQAFELKKRENEAAKALIQIQSSQRLFGTGGAAQIQGVSQAVQQFANNNPAGLTGRDQLEAVNQRRAAFQPISQLITSGLGETPKSVKDISDKLNEQAVTATKTLLNDLKVDFADLGIPELSAALKEANENLKDLSGLTEDEANAIKEQFRASKEEGGKGREATTAEVRDVFLKSQRETVDNENGQGVTIGSTFLKSQRFKTRQEVIKEAPDTLENNKTPQTLQQSIADLDKSAFAKNIEAAVTKGISLTYGGQAIPVNGNLSFSLGDKQVSELGDFIQKMLGDQLNQVKTDIQSQVDVHDLLISDIQKQANITSPPFNIQQ